MTPNDPIVHLEHDLFLLMLNLTQLKEPTRIISVFTDAVNSFLKSNKLRQLTDNESDAPGITIPIATVRNSFGQFVLEGEVANLPNEYLALINNSIRMLAVILENCKQAKLLLNERERLELVVQERTKELVESNSQLREEIEERKRIRRELLFTKFTMDHNSDAAYWVDEAGNFKYVNKAASHSLGYTIAELLKMTAFDINPSFTQETWKAHWNKIKEKGSFKLETQHRTKSGKLIPVEVAANFMKFEDMEYNCAFVRDISRRRAMEHQLQQAQKMEAIGTLAGGIAHDFNNILAAIIGFADMVQSGMEPGSKAWDNQQQVLRAGDRAKELVKQILTFSRQSEQDKTPIRMRLIIKEAMKLLRASIPSTIEIKENICRSGDWVMGNGTQIHQIIMNLCTNAYFAMRETGGVLAIELTPVEIEKQDDKATFLDLAAGKYLVLKISDTGHGMSRATQDRIFEPYFTTKKKGEGTGMGLAVVHGIVKSHGGLITVYSELGQGTAFQVYLPRIIMEKPTDINKHKGDIPKGKERILVVEDEEVILNLEQQMLESLGYIVTPILSATSALKTFSKNPNGYDLVITDMTMPHMTGAELSRKMLALRPELRIIMYTGFSELISEDKAKSIGIKAFVMKPVVRKELASIVRKVLDSKE